MPLIVELTYESGRVEEVRIPAEIWRRDDVVVTRLFVTEEPIVSIVLDPHLETADVDMTNNRFPAEIIPRALEIEPRQKRDNPMQIARRIKQRAETKTAAKKLGERLFDSWKNGSGPQGTPADQETALLEEATTSRLLVDPWGNSFQIVFSGAPLDADPAETRFALIRCHGPDQEAATGDDLRFVLYRDGRFEEGGGKSR